MLESPYSQLAYAAQHYYNAIALGTAATVISISNLVFPMVVLAIALGIGYLITATGMEEDGRIRLGEVALSNPGYRRVRVYRAFCLDVRQRSRRRAIAGALRESRAP